MRGQLQGEGHGVGEARGEFFQRQARAIEVEPDATEGDGGDAIIRQVLGDEDRRW